MYSIEFRRNKLYMALRTVIGLELLVVDGKPNPDWRPMHKMIMMYVALLKVGNGLSLVFSFSLKLTIHIILLRQPLKC